MMKSLPSAESNSALQTNAQRHSIIVDLHDNTIVYKYAYTDDASAASLLGELPLEPLGKKQVNFDSVSRRVAQITRAVADSNFVNLTRLSKKLSRQLFPTELSVRLKKATSGNLVLLLDPDLSYIPWELLWNNGTFLCRRFCVARSLHKSGSEGERAKEQLLKTASGKALILFGKVDGPLIAAGKEYDIIAEVLKPIYGTRIVFHTTQTSDDALEYLSESYYDLCHFIGHGIWNEEIPDESGWQFPDGSVLTCKQIQDDATDIKFPRLIVANSCHSARSVQPTRSGEQSLHDPSTEGANAAVSELHRSFLSQGVPHYIGTIAQVPDEVSQVFTRVFYESLVSGRQIGESLFRAREVASANQGWAFYVHYGNPLDRVVEGDPSKGAFTTDLPGPGLVEPTKETTWKTFAAVTLRYRRRALGGLASILLLAVLGWYLHWRAGIFHPDEFGIALARFEIKDFSKSSIRSYAEDLLSPEELTGRLVQAGVAPAVLEIKKSQRAFTSGADARAWGASHGASLVIWGTAERGSQGFIVHLRASRIPLPETANRTETYRRFFVQKLFPEYFRDTETYATDFELGGVAIDLGNPAGISMLGSETTEFIRFCQGVLVYTKGEYPDAVKILEQVAASNTTKDVRQLARRWLVLTYLNARNYADAERTFAALMDQKSASDEDAVRHAFLQAAYSRNVHRTLTPWINKMEKEKLWEILDTGKLSPYLGTTAAVMLADGLIDRRIEQWPANLFGEGAKGQHRLAKFEETLERAVTDLPEDYFLQYIRAMLSRNVTIADEALERAAKLQPQAAETHFGRAVRFSQRGDTEAALREINTAIAVEPKQFGYWEEKRYLLDGLQYNTLGQAYNEAQLQEIAFAEEAMKKHYGNRLDRRLLAGSLAKDYVYTHKLEQAVAVLEQGAAELPWFCKDAAIISMREIGSLPLARKFLECAAHQSSSVADQGFERLRLEYQWRNGDYDVVKDRFVNHVFRNRWSKDPGESPAVLDTIGNVLHAEGRYNEAKKLLQAAKQSAVKVSRIPENRRYQDYPDENRIWNWTASFDLALVYLSQGNSAEAVRELRHTRDYLRTTPDCPDCRESKKSFYDSTRFGLAYVTEMYLGYASFEQRDYDAAAQAWLAATVPMAYAGFPSQQSLEDVGHDLTENLHGFMEDPEHPGKTGIRPEVIVDQMFLLHKYADARNLMARYILSRSMSPDNLWTARLLVAFLKTHDLERVDQLFMEFVRSDGGSLSSKAPRFAGVASSLHSLIEGEELPTTEPSFFWDVISRNPYPE
jgi:tetratricopeptide (TPR) repeat protein/CHAT domain-containing protein